MTKNIFKYIDKVSFKNFNLCPAKKKAKILQTIKTFKCYAKFIKKG
jgi:hypothetical protein